MTEEPDKAVRVRAATPADLAAIRCIGFVTWPVTYGPLKGPAFVAEGLDTYWGPAALMPAIEAGNVIVADMDGDTIGMAQVETEGSDVVMWKLYVLPSHHGQGVGSALVREVVRRASHAGLGVLTEYVDGNVAAERFYRSQGFSAWTMPGDDLGAVWLRLTAAV